MSQPNRTSGQSSGRDTGSIEDSKRDLINSLERDRRRTASVTTRTSTPTPQATSLPANHAAETDPMTAEVLRLREELRLAHATNGLLEEELYRLEQKTLSAIAEAGTLRQKLDGKQRELDMLAMEGAVDHMDHLTDALEASQTDATLLTQALLSSETEIAKLVKNMDHVTRLFARRG